MNHNDFDLIRRKDKPTEYLRPKQQIKIVKERERERQKMKRKSIKDRMGGKTTTTITTTNAVGGDDGGERKKRKKKESSTTSNVGTTRGSTTTTTTTKSTKVSGTKRPGEMRTTTTSTTSTTSKRPSTGGPVTKKQKRSRAVETDKKEKEMAEKALMEYKNLRDCVNKWTIWHMPSDLREKLEGQQQSQQGQTIVEKGKGSKQQTTKNKQQQQQERDDPSRMNDEGSDDDESIDLDPLLCDEGFPFDEEDEADEDQNQRNFIDLVVQNTRERTELESELDRLCQIPPALGTTLPASKFNTPTTLWRTVSVGTRVGVYWRDDDQYYNASIIKHQEGSSYFHLHYDDDGHLEWLDLSREEFKILNDDNEDTATMIGDEANTNITGQRRRHNSTEITTTMTRATSASTAATQDTPRKDNRSNRSFHNPFEERTTSAVPAMMVPEKYSHLAPLLRYSWHDLGLGRIAGTPSYNDFITRHDTTATPLTPLQVLEEVHSLRFRGIPAPSEWDDIMGMIDSNNDDNRDGDNDSSSRTRLASILKQLKDDISKDGTTTTTSSSRLNYDKDDATMIAVRRITDHWNSSTMVETLRRLETQSVFLADREEQIRDKCKRVGIF